MKIACCNVKDSYSTIIMSNLIVLLLLFSYCHHAAASPDTGATLLRIINQELPIVSNLYNDNKTTARVGISKQYSFKSIVGNSTSLPTTKSDWKIIDNVGCLVIENYTQPFNVIYQNELDEPVIIHAHGLTPPSILDGAPYISSLPLEPGRQQLVKYSLQENNVGTNMLHSHYAFQLGEGMSAPLIIKGRIDPKYPLYNELQGAQESVMFLQDVCPYALSTNEELLSPVNRNRGALHRLRSRVRSCDRRAVYAELKAKMQKTNQPEAKCPNITPATSHNVQYEKFIANGRSLDDPVKVKVTYGKYVRLRILNATGMTTFRIQIPGPLIHRSYIVAVDGQLIHPLQLESFWLTNAQRVDLLIHVPEKDEIDSDAVFSILAAREGKTSSVQAGIILYAQDVYPAHIQNPPVISKKTFGFMDNSDEMLMRAWNPLPKKMVDKVFDINLTRDNGLEGINGHSYQMVPEVPYAPNPNPLRVQKGQRVQLNFLNNIPDGHPMHLHGHSFQVVAIDGKPLNGAVRDTVIIPGGCHSVTVIFDADNPGIWPLHCHMEYHLAAGMMTTIEYYDQSHMSHSGW